MLLKSLLSISYTGTEQGSDPVSDPKVRGEKNGGLKQVKHGHPLGITHRYVEQNPVRANLSRPPYDWKWSSAHLRTSGIQPDYLYSPRGWHRSFMKKYVNDIPLSEDELNQVRLPDPTI